MLAADELPAAEWRNLALNALSAGGECRLASGLLTGPRSDGGSGFGEFPDGNRTADTGGRANHRLASGSGRTQIRHVPRRCPIFEDRGGSRGEYAGLLDKTGRNRRVAAMRRRPTRLRRRVGL